MKDHEEEEEDLGEPNNAGVPLKKGSRALREANLLEDLEEEGNPYDLDDGDAGQEVIFGLEEDGVDDVTRKGIEGVRHEPILPVTVGDDPPVHDDILGLGVVNPDSEVQEDVKEQTALRRAK